MSAINPIFSHRIAITMTPSEANFITLQTYTPEHGKSQRFLVWKDTVLSLLGGEKSSVIDCDLNNYLHLRFDGSVMSFKAVWLSVNPRDSVTGRVQRFSVPADMMHRVLSGQTVNHISHTDEPLEKARLVFSKDAQAAIGRYSEDRHTRRALSKFFRDNLNYGRSEKIYVYADSYVNGFYVCSPITGFNGGIVLSKGTVRHYGFPKQSFSLHT